MPDRPTVEFVDWRDIHPAPARNEKLMDVYGPEGATCRLVLAATATGLDISITDSTGQVRLTTDDGCDCGDMACPHPDHRDATPQPAAPTYAISLTEDAEGSRPNYRRYRLTSPAGAVVLVAQMNGAQDELALALVDADDSVTATIGYASHTTEWPHPVSDVRPAPRTAGPIDLGDDPDGDLDGAYLPPFAGLTDDATDDITCDVPDDVRMLRAALAAARRRVRVYEPDGPDGAQAWTLYTGYRGEYDLDNAVDPVLIVVGTEAAARAEADARNLARLAEHGSLAAAAVTRVLPHAAPVLFGDHRP